MPRSFCAAETFCAEPHRIFPHKTLNEARPEGAIFPAASFCVYNPRANQEESPFTNDPLRCDLQSEVTGQSRCSV